MSEINALSILADLTFDRGQQYHAVGQFERAAHFYAHTLTIIDEPTVHEAMMYALIMLRKFKEAIPHCTKAIGEKSQTKKDLAQYNRGLCYLMTNDYINGFKDYDTRMRMGQTEDILRKKIDRHTLWNGTPCDHLLVYGEQGMGDLFMFSGLVTELIKRKLAKKITFEVPKDMESFMRHNFPTIEVVGQTDKITSSDEHILLISLARVLGVTKEAIPQPRLIPIPETLKKWSYIGKLPGIKIGLCWAGRSEAMQDIQVAEWNSRRSVALAQLESLFTIEGATFVSVQKGVDEAQADEYPFIQRPNIENWSDTAAIMSNLDMVISIDSGPVHLAGALGIPTLLLNHLFTCWRWDIEGKQAPWYNSITVLRQKREADWSAPIKEAKDILTQLAQKKEAA